MCACFSGSLVQTPVRVDQHRSMALAARRPAAGASLAPGDEAAADDLENDDYAADENDDDTQVFEEEGTGKRSTAPALEFDDVDVQASVKAALSPAGAVDFAGLVSWAQPPALQEGAGNAAFSAEHTAEPMINTVPELRVTVESVFGGTDAALARRVFPFGSFNGVQSNCLPAFTSNDNVLISAPTGAGKTAIFELAIMRMFWRRIGLRRMPPGMAGSANDHGGAGSPAKAVYLAPIKALCRERVLDWQAKFGVLGLNVVELTSDSATLDSLVHQARMLNSAHVIVATPEKWESVTRRWKSGYATMLPSVGLLLMDEVHMLNLSDRGPALEAIVSRMRLMQSSAVFALQPISSIRLLAVSATIPNVAHVGAWLGVLPHNIKVFGPAFRPVPLSLRVVGFAESRSAFLFERNLTFRLYSVILESYGGRPVLVFCASRQGVASTARHLVERDIGAGMNPFVQDVDQRRRLSAAARQVESSALAAVLGAGVGFHAASLTPADRHTVESLFLAGDLRVLCTTTTLALGVNLPAHCVIIKSTQRYKSGQYQEYDELEVLQMIGRAGRPQFDSSACAVILTTNAQAARYRSLSTGQQPIRSHLLDWLPELLNTEIVLQTVRCEADALRWLGSSFLFVHARADPNLYFPDRPVPTGGAEGSRSASQIVEQALLARVRLALRSHLLKTGLIEQVRDGGAVDQNQADTGPTSYYRARPSGEFMSSYCIRFNTMRLFVSVPGSAGVPELLAVLCQASELASVMLRRNERRPLAELNRRPPRGAADASTPQGASAVAAASYIHFPLESRTVHGTADKLNVLLQAHLGGLRVEHTGLAQEIPFLMPAFERLSRALVQSLLNRPSDGALAELSAIRSACLLAKSVRAGLWYDSVFVTRQFAHVGPSLSRRLVEAGAVSLDSLLGFDASALERACARNAPFGEKLLAAARDLPRLDMSVSVAEVRDDGGVLRGWQASCTIVVHEYAGYGKPQLAKVPPRSGRVWYTLLCGLAEPNLVLHVQRIDATAMIRNSQGCRLDVPIDLAALAAGRVALTGTHVSLVVELICADYVGLDVAALVALPLAAVAHAPTAERAPAGACQHRCRDKSLCAHACCKLGLGAAGAAGAAAVAGARAAQPAPDTGDDAAAEDLLAALHERFVHRGKRAREHDDGDTESASGPKRRAVLDAAKAADAAVHQFALSLPGSAQGFRRLR